MATQSGLTVDLKKVDLVLGAVGPNSGFRVDALDAGGIALAWQGDFATVAQGADDIDVIVIVGSTYAIITITNMMSAQVIDYVNGWIESRTPKGLSLRDRNGKTTLATSRAMPRQRPGMTWSNTHNPTTIDIHCPGMTGAVGSLSLI